jgi:hypothetical protein
VAVGKRIMGGVNGVTEGMRVYGSHGRCLPMLQSRVAAVYHGCMLEELRDMLRRAPFHRFRIITTSGHVYEVDDPLCLAMAESYLFCAYPKSDRSARIRLNQIVALEAHEAAK